MQKIVQFYKQNAKMNILYVCVCYVLEKYVVLSHKSQDYWLQNSSTIDNEWLRLTIYCLTWKWIMFNDRMFQVLPLAMHMIPFTWLTCCRHCQLINLYILIFFGNWTLFSKPISSSFFSLFNFVFEIFAFKNLSFALMCWKYIFFLAPHQTPNVRRDFVAVYTNEFLFD